MSADRQDPCPICHKGGEDAVKILCDYGINEDGTADIYFEAVCQCCGATWTMESKVSAEVDDDK